VHAAPEFAGCFWQLPPEQTPLLQSSSEPLQSFTLCRNTPPEQTSVVHGLLSVQAAGFAVHPVSLSVCVQPEAPHVSDVQGFLSSQLVAGCVHAPVAELQRSSVHGFPSEQFFEAST
jgi:hypothetical protein